MTPNYILAIYYFMVLDLYQRVPSSDFSNYSYAIVSVRGVSGWLAEGLLRVLHILALFLFLSLIKWFFPFAQLRSLEMTIACYELGPIEERQLLS